MKNAGTELCCVRGRTSYLCFNSLCDEHKSGWWTFATGVGWALVLSS